MKVHLLFIVLAFSMNAGAANTFPEIDRYVDTVEDDVIAWRRDIHANPELSNREFRTAKLIENHLTDLGLKVNANVAHTGVVAVLEGNRAGSVVALRADMDALPVREQTGLPFASQKKVMHACGHDAHVAILMGVAQVLSRFKQHIPGTVVFIFQPAEEGPPAGEEGGAELMVREGVLARPQVDAIFGLHVTQQIAVGQAGVRPGPMLAGSHEFGIRVTGKQTHAALPWQGVDPIVTGAEIVLALQTIVSRTLDITSAPAVVSIGKVQGGTRSNIIPASLEMSGTVRTFDLPSQKRILERIETIAKGIAGGHGATAELIMGRAIPPVRNDPALTGMMKPVLNSLFGTANVIHPPLLTGSEDFAFYQEKIPGMYFFLGVRSKDIPLKDVIPNHSPYFDVDEEALVWGVRAMAYLAVDYLMRAGS